MKRGRPREVQNPVRIDIRVPAHDYDYLDRLARANDVSIASIIRRAISAVKYRKMAQTSAY